MGVIGKCPRVSNRRRWARRTGRGRLEEDGTFRIDLDQEDLAPGQDTVLVTLTRNGNTVDPDIRAVRYEAR
jgi:hypothetical protein